MKYVYFTQYKNFVRAKLTLTSYHFIQKYSDVFLCIFHSPVLYTEIYGAHMKNPSKSFKKLLFLSRQQNIYDAETS